jgi:hypothetical protein
MSYVAVILVVGGIVALVWGAMQKYKAGRLAKAPFVSTGDAGSQGSKVAGERGAISVEGRVTVVEPLRSPVTGSECLYYELEVVGSWKDGDSKESKKYLEEKRAADIRLDDGSGAVRIDANQGGDFEPLKQTFDETKKEGFLADLKSAIGKGKPIMFGHYAFTNPVNSKASEFRCIERVMPVQPRLYVCGKSADNAIGSPNWTSLVMSHKSRDELLGSTGKSAKLFLVSGAVAAAAGTALGLIANLM